MAARTAYISPMLIAADGSVIDRTNKTTTYNDVMNNVATEMRIVADPDNSNTLNNPSIEDYIQLESVSGRHVVSLTNTVVVTNT